MHVFNLFRDLLPSIQAIRDHPGSGLFQKKGRIPEKTAHDRACRGISQNEGSLIEISYVFPSKWETPIQNPVFRPLWEADRRKPA